MSSRPGNIETATNCGSAAAVGEGPERTAESWLNAGATEIQAPKTRSHTTSGRLCNYCRKSGNVIGRATLNGKSAFWHPRCFKKAQRELLSDGVTR